MSEARIVKDTFQRPDTAPGGAGTFTGVGNDWRDVLGGVWEIDGNCLIGTSGSTFNFRTQFVLRPTNDNYRNGTVRIVFTADAGGWTPFPVIRHQASGKCYVAWSSGGGTAYEMNVMTSGGNTALTNGFANTGTLTLVNGTRYVMTFTATSTDPTHTDLYVQVTTEVDPGTVLASATATGDMDSDLQAVGSWGSSFINSIVINAIELYNADRTRATPTEIHPAGAPYVWDLDGSGNHLRTNAPGAYIGSLNADDPGIEFTGTSVSLLVDNQTWAAHDDTHYPVITWTIDGGELQTLQLPRGAVHELASGLADTSHRLMFWANVLARGYGDRWTLPAVALTVTGLLLDDGETVSVSATRPNRILFFGDSVMEGVDNELGGYNGSDAMRAFPSFVAAVRDAEYGQLGFSSRTWTGDASVPMIHNAWAYYSDGRSRLSSGYLSPGPNDIVVVAGEGPTPTDVTINVASFVDGVRAAAPVARIWIFPPAFGGAARGTSISTIGAAVGAYLVAHPNETRLFFIDPGEAFTEGLEGTASLESDDGIHARVSYGHPKIAATIVDDMARAETPTSLMNAVLDVPRALLDFETSDFPAGTNLAAIFTAIHDKLPAGNLASSDEVTSIQNNTTCVRSVPTVIDRPDSGTQAFRIELFLYDTDGNMEAPDSAPTIDVVNASGTSRTGRLDSTTMSLIATGRYRVIYTASDTDGLEQLMWTFTVVESAQTRLYTNTTTVLDIDAVPADSTGLTTLLGKFTGITLLAKWLQAFSRKSTPDTTALTEINAGGGTFLPSTDSLEALSEGVHVEGTGTIAVNHNTGGADNLKFLSGGVAVDGGDVRAYLKTDFDAGRVSQAYIKGQTRTGPVNQGGGAVSGRMPIPMYLSGGSGDITYTLSFTKQGTTTVVTDEITI